MSVSLTLEIAKQPFHVTLWLMHHHTKFGYKELSHSKNIFKYRQTFNEVLNSHCDLDRSKAFFTRYPWLWWCTIKLSLVMIIWKDLQNRSYNRNCLILIMLISLHSAIMLPTPWWQTEWILHHNDNWHNYWVNIYSFRQQKETVPLPMPLCELRQWSHKGLDHKWPRQEKCQGTQA